MKITIVGTGYVGLVTAVCFAKLGHSVTCLDTDADKIATLKEKKAPFYEPGLQELLQEQTLHFTTSYEEGARGAEIVFLCLPTPARDDGSCDTSYIFSAVDSLLVQKDAPSLIAIKSTVPIGTAKEITLRSKGSLSIVSNPEFLKEGDAVNDCLHPARIILGSEDPSAIALMKALYNCRDFPHAKILVMDNASAEMTKYAANCMLAARISLMNELSSIAEMTGANIQAVKEGIGSDPRIGPHFLMAGIGFGGSCFPKDIRALRFMAKREGLSTLLLDAVEEINQRQKKLLAKKIVAYFATRGGIRGKTIAIWGLSFKPETDDIREAPSIPLIQELLQHGAHLRLFDPIATEKMRALFPNLPFCNSVYEAASGADAIALVTEWKQFQSVDLLRLLSIMKGKAFFDGRNLFSSAQVRQVGMDYAGIGVP